MWHKVDQGGLVLHDNATAHRAAATQKKLDYLVFNVQITHHILWI
jgi:hypothetical protein